MNLWSNKTLSPIVNRSLRFVFMIIKCKECLVYNASIWGHIISKNKSLVYTTNKAQNSPTLTQ